MNGFFFRTLALLALGIATFGATSAVAQETLRPRWSIFGGLAINAHTADFRALPGVPNCCPRFESGSGLGPFFGARYELPIGESLLLSLGANWIDHSALLAEREPVAIALGEVAVDGAFEHSIDAGLSSVGVEPAVSLRVIDRLFVRSGVRIGMILSPSYDQKEEIVEPAGAGTFLDSLGNDSGLRTRNVRSGDIPDAATLLVQGVLGVEYELPLNADRTLFLTPGLSWTQSFTDVVNGYTWKPNGLRLSVGLTWSPLPAKRIVRDTVYRRDTTTVTVARNAAPAVRLDDRTESIEKTEEEALVTERITIDERYLREVPKARTLTTSLAAVGVDNGREEPAATMRIEEFLRMNAHPLLGYVFFGEGSAEIPGRYVRMESGAAGRFRPETLFEEDALGIARNVLNILGHNLRRHPQARLTITGCNSDNGAEQGNRDLSRRRAEAVRDYLVDVWGIAPERLSTVERDLPAIPSNRRTADGSEENRRVEIVSDVPEVTDVFIAHDTTRSATPPVLRFKPAARAAEPIASWKLTIRQGGGALKEFSGTGAPPAAIDWEIAGEKSSVPRFSEPVTAELEAVTVDGETSTSATTLATEVITVRQKEERGAKDYRVDQYNLVLFDVGKATVTGAHRRTIELVRSRLKPGSTISVEGYSDRSGDADANRRLALARAKATAAALGRGDAKAVGIGEDRLLYANDTPEGRFYCRTVQITVRTPVR